MMLIFFAHAVDLYGYGTGWLWMYFPSIVVVSLGSFVWPYSLRFSNDTWNSMFSVKAWNVMSTAVGLYIPVFVPLTGCISKHL